MGDGGAVVTDDDEVAARCRRLRDHGRLNKDVHAEIGFNLRFNDIQAAIGRVLLRRLDAMNDRRRALAARYDAGSPACRSALPRSGRAPATSITSTWCARRAGTSSPRFLKARGIETGIHYPVPSHRQPAVERFDAPPAARAPSASWTRSSRCRSPPATPTAEIDEVVRRPVTRDVLRRA